jgi:hypothetical protein
MQLSLVAVKHTRGIHAPTRNTTIFLAVIDLEKAKRYPANFVCLLPDNRNFESTKFARIYGESSKETAQTLLRMAFDRESDTEIKHFINERLKRLNREDAKASITQN